MKARFAALLAVGAASAAIAAAPAAIAQPNCSTTAQGGGPGGGSTKVCETPGDAEISTIPPENATYYWGGILPFENYGPVHF
ncbi:hypothetical protein PDG61_00030 [Mycolicibacterium sp. BiH015]|uniref:hypothetical protein n=1 Tax=Mycolicibacterium sp. BiH015 TaxID=3018808 RepID=UPI0022DF8A07|nr:hypothetical protein [Mycolicibacterium sp. BiH015]MDA2889290.1 hypothetical protein [Mycolicibacterium sp. BiH015]